MPRRPAGSTDAPWQYPTSFAVNFTSGTPGNRPQMLLVDMSNNGQSHVSSCGVFRTTDGGATWRFRQQAGGSTHVAIDPKRPWRAYASSQRSIDPWSVSMPGGWGYGGPFYSNDGGETWLLNEAVPMQANVYSATPDPSFACKVYYTTFGGGVLSGPAPPGLPNC